MTVVKAHDEHMTTATCIQENEEQQSITEETSVRSGLQTPARPDRVQRSLRGFWRDQVYLHEQLLVAQRPWDNARDPR
jgi:hypothetical protein